LYRRSADGPPLWGKPPIGAAPTFLRESFGSATARARARSTTSAPRPRWPRRSRMRFRPARRAHVARRGRRADVRIALEAKRRPQRRAEEIRDEHLGAPPERFGEPAHACIRLFASRSEVGSFAPRSRSGEILSFPLPPRRSVAATGFAQPLRDGSTPSRCEAVARSGRAARRARATRPRCARATRRRPAAPRDRSRAHAR